MSDILDQSEIDRLLAAADSGTAEEVDQNDLIFSTTGASAETVEIKPYDFKRPERVSKDQMLALQTLHEVFARNFGASLSGFLRTIIEVKGAICEQMTYSEFISGLPNPTSFNLINTDKLEGQICLELSPLIVYPIIDRLLGGTSQDLFIPERPMTLIETRLISNVISRALTTLAEAWETVCDLKFTVASTENNPQLVQIVPPNEVVIVVGFEIKMASRAGTMNLCIPYTVIEPIMEDLSAQNWFNSAKLLRTQGVKEKIESGLGKATIGVAGLLAETTMTMSDLARMKVGDVIATETRTTRPVSLTVEGQPKFLASLGQHRGHKALRIIQPITAQT